MKKIKFLISCLLVLIIAALVTFFVLQYTKNVPAPHIKEMMKFQTLLKEGKPAFTTKEVDIWVSEMIPLVEKTTGKKFKQMPKVELIDRNGVTKVLIRDLLPQFRNLMQDMNEAQHAKTAETQAKGIAPFLLGKYGMEDNVLYLMPRNVFPIFKLAKIKKKHIPSVTKIIIAHELTHVLQDQEIDIGNKFRKIKGTEESEALNATIEGHAVFIQDMVGNQLKLNDALLECSRLLSAGLVKFSEPALKMLSKMTTARFEQIYLGGKKFIEYHYNKGGNKRIWEILATPPLDTSMITNPETYSPVCARKLDYAKILQGLEEIEWLGGNYFRKKEWSIWNLEVTKFQLRSSYANMETKKREEIISKIAHVQTIQASNNKGLLGSVTLILLKDDRYGHKYISTVEEMVKNNVERMKKGTMYKIEDLSIESFAGIKADIIRRLSFTLKPRSGEDKKAVFIRICRGNVIVEIVSINIPINDDQIIEIAQTVFERYREAKERQDLQQS